jgi:putative acetyltransferase
VIEIRRADPRDFADFLRASDDYAASLYPAESNHMLDVATLMRPEIYFAGVFDGGRKVGCGGFWAHQDYVEIKRVWIDPAARGRGLSRLLMRHLEHEARSSGHSIARLETGVSQPEALGLYRRMGYAACDPFGDYRPDPLSVFMEKIFTSLST